MNVDILKRIHVSNTFVHIYILYCMHAGRQAGRQTETERQAGRQADRQTDRHTYTLIHLYTFTLIHLYTYTLLHLYTFTHIHVYTYTLIHLYSLYTYTLIHLYTYTRIRVYTYTLLHLYYTYTLIHTYVRTYMHACIHTYLHTYIHTYIYIIDTCIQIHMCIYKYTHICIFTIYLHTHTRMYIYIIFIALSSCWTRGVGDGERERERARTTCKYMKRETCWAKGPTDILNRRIWYRNNSGCITSRPEVRFPRTRDRFGNYWWELVGSEMTWSNDLVDSKADINPAHKKIRVFSNWEWSRWGLNYVVEFSWRMISLGIAWMNSSWTSSSQHWTMHVGPLAREVKDVVHLGVTL